MKKLMASFLILVSSVYASFDTYTEVVLSCSAKNEGYTVAKRIDLMFMEKSSASGELSIEYVNLNHHNSFHDQGGHVDPVLQTYYGVDISQNGNDNWQFSYGIEYFDNTITLVEDDNGYKLFTEYISDGPHEYGFYECNTVNRENHINTYDGNAWTRLNLSIDYDIAVEYEVTIMNEADCGEHDPYFLGDACSYKAKVFNSDVTIMFYDYNSFKEGQKIKVKGIPITDFDNYSLNNLLIVAEPI